LDDHVQLDQLRNGDFDFRGSDELVDERLLPDREFAWSEDQGPLMGGLCWGWKRLGYAERFRAHIVNYADDLVVCCRENAAEALQAMRQNMTRLKLTVNEEKTHVCRLPEQYFYFLGYRFGRFYSFKTGQPHWGTCPSKKSVKRLIRSIHEQTAHRTCSLEAEELVESLNRMLRGWANYFKLGPVGKAYRSVDLYTATRLRRWLCHKHKVHSGGYGRYTSEYVHRTLGLIQLTAWRRNLPWVTT
jgi:RNA-directed DNA polymerase